MQEVRGKSAGRDTYKAVGRAQPTGCLLSYLCFCIHLFVPLSNTTSQELYNSLRQRNKVPSSQVLARPVSEHEQLHAVRTGPPSPRAARPRDTGAMIVPVGMFPTSSPRMIQHSVVQVSSPPRKQNPVQPSPFLPSTPSVLGRVDRFAQINSPRTPAAPFSLGKPTSFNKTRTPVPTKGTGGGYTTPRTAMPGECVFVEFVAYLSSTPLEIIDHLTIPLPSPITFWVLQTPLACRNTGVKLQVRGSESRLHIFQ